MARFRLRFLLQEFDLTGNEITVGRSPDCHLSIEDPLVSRQHARIRTTDSAAFISDMGSRNGVRVNGRTIDGETQLRDGDRIRLGTQELVFSVVNRPERAARPTGFLSTCKACGTPYPEGAPACPHCGATAVSEEDTTISGLPVEPRRGWAMQLLGEVIERTISSGRTAEADKLLRRASKEVDERIANGESVDAAELAKVATFAVRVAALAGSSEWVGWVFSLYDRAGTLPPDSVIEAISSPDVLRLSGASEIVHGFLANSKVTQERGSASLARLEQLTQRS